MLRFRRRAGAGPRHPQRHRPATSTGTTGATDALVAHGVDPARPYVLFVGRITRQKGIIHLVNAIPQIDPALQVVLCAGAPDTPEIGREMAERVAEVSAGAAGRDLDPGDAAARRGDPALLARGGVLLPLGLRAVRHHQPRGDGLRDRGGRLARSAASRRSWCPSETGLLVDLTLRPGTFEPADPAAFSRGARGRDQPPRPRPRAARQRWAGRAASGCSSTSAGMRSPRPRSSSTARLR